MSNIPKCPECQNPLDYGAKFCGNCGFTLDTMQFCANCQSPIGATQVFCIFCGSKIVSFERKLAPRWRDRINEKARNIYPAIFFSLFISLLMLLSVPIGLVGGVLSLEFFPSQLDSESLVLALTIPLEICVAIVLFKLLPWFEVQPRYIGLNKNVRLVYVIKGFVIAWLGIYLSISIMDFFLSWLFTYFSLPIDISSPYDPFLTSSDILFLGLFAVLAIIIAPLIEEFVFRGCLIPLFQRRGLGQWGAVVASSLVFAMSHIQADLLQGSIYYAILHLTTTTILGIFLGAVYVRTRSLASPVLFHALINSTAVFGSLIVRYTDSSQFLVMMDIVFSLLGILVILFHRKSLRMVPMLLRLAKLGIKKSDFALNVVMAFLIAILIPTILLAFYMSFDPENIVSLSLFLLLNLYNLLVVVLSLVIVSSNEQQSFFQQSIS